MRSEFRRVACPDGVELLRAVVWRGCYAMHSHDEATIALLDEGSTEFLLDGRRWRARAGSIVVIPAGVPHTGGASDRRVAYRALLVGAEVLARACGPDARLRAGVLEDRDLAARLARLHDDLMGEQAPASACNDLASVLGALPRGDGVRREVGGTPSPAAPSIPPSVGAPPAWAPGRQPRRVGVVREYLAANLHSSPSLDALSDLVGLSPFYLQRTFKAATCMSPREYLMDLRIRRARVLLRQGVPPRQVSSQVGFFDQSHFTRAFRRLTGVTPGQFAAGDGRASGAVE